MSDKNATEIVIAAVIGSLSLMLALAWNDSAKVIIEKYVASKDGNTIKANLIYTLAVTIFVVAVILAIQKRENLKKLIK